MSRPTSANVPGTVIEPGIEKPPDMLDAELSASMVKRTDKLNDNTIELALRLKQAREFIAWSTHHIRGSWMDWMEQANNAQRHLNEFRMAFEREGKTITASAKDVVGFFNSPEYAQAMDRFKDTIALLDKFSALKTNGTLDAFADFILKIQCK